MTNLGNRRWWALGAITLAVLAVGLDGTVLSVALPTLAGALHASESDLQWFSSGYLLVLAAAMLPAGLLGDRYGRKKVMLTALALFGAGSAACAYRALGRRIHRGAGDTWTGRGGHRRDGTLRADGALHRRGAAAGGWYLGSRQLPGAANRPDPGRLAADALLVGLGVPDERAGCPARADRRLRARSGVARAGAPRPGSGWDHRLDCRTGRCDLWADRGGSERLG